MMMNRKIFWPIFLGSTVTAFMAIAPLTEAPDTSPELVVFQQNSPRVIRVAAAQKNSIIAEATQASAAKVKEELPQKVVNNDRTPSWVAVEKQFPKLQIVRTETVPVADGKVEKWVLFQTSRGSDDLWIFREGPTGAMAAQAGQLLLRSKSMDSVSEWKQALAGEEVSVQVASPELGLYAVEFDPENLELYRQLVGLRNESQSEALEPNYMVGVW